MKAIYGWLIVILVVCVVGGALVLHRIRTDPDARRAMKQIGAKVVSKATTAMTGAKLLGTLSDPRINESSGLAASTLNRDVLWTHNDSGDGPYLFAIDHTGRTLARCTVPDTTNADWEGIAIGPGADGRPALYIADIGDNNRRRQEYAVYRIPEPGVDTSRTMQELTSAPAEKFPFRYPDGPHNAEALLVHPKTGGIGIITKSPDGKSAAYAFPTPLQAGQTVTLRRIAPLDFSTRGTTGLLREARNSVTAADIAPDGRHLIVRTYLAAFEWDIEPGKSLVAVLQGRRHRRNIPFEVQGESICYRPDGRAILMTSEKAPTPLYEMPIR